MDTKTTTNVVKLIEEVDWNSLNTIIGAKIGSRVSLTPVSNEKRIELKSSLNYVSRTGVFAHVFTEVRVEGYAYLHQENPNILIANIQVRWEYKDGGSNGTQLMWLEYNRDNNFWKIS